MSVSWAYLFLADGADPLVERMVREGRGERVTIVPVPDEAAAVRVAAELVADGVGLIELCGAFGPAGAARVIDAVHGRAAVGTVGFGIESLQAAAAYQRAAEVTSA